MIYASINLVLLQILDIRENCPALWYTNLASKGRGLTLMPSNVTVQRRIDEPMVQDWHNMGQLVLHPLMMGQYAELVPVQFLTD